MHGAHGADAEVGGIHQLVAAASGPLGGRDGTRQLLPDGLAPKADHLIQGLGRRLVGIVGVEGRGVGGHQAVQLAAGPGIKGIQAAALNILLHDFFQPVIILPVVGLRGHQGIEEVGSGKCIVNGAVHHLGGILASAHAPEGEVIIPGNQIQHSLGFIQVIVVGHIAGEAVLVHGENVHRHIPQQIVNIHAALQIRRPKDIFQGGHHSFVVSVGGFGHRSIPDGGVAVQAVVGVVQIRTAAAGTGTHNLVFRLIQAAVLGAVIAQQEAVPHSLQGQVYSPIFSVDGDFRILIQGGIRPHKGEQVVNQCLLHVGGIGIIVVENQLVQAEAGLPLYIFVEFQLKAVAVGVRVADDGREAGIPLGADTHLIEGLAPDFHVAGVVFLLYGVLQHIRPLGFLHKDVHSQHLVGAEEPGCVFHGNAPALGRCYFTGKAHSADAQGHRRCHEPGNGAGNLLGCSHRPALRRGIPRCS